MATLLDIASLSEFVKIPGKGGVEQELEVFGVSAEGIVMLLKRFPEIQMLMTGKALEGDQLATLAPPAIAAIIAAATGTTGNKKAELIASRLPLELQMEILEAVIKLTMPNGLGPFVKRLQDMAAMLGANASSAESIATEADMKLPSLSSI